LKGGIIGSDTRRVFGAYGTVSVGRGKSIKSASVAEKFLVRYLGIEETRVPAVYTEKNNRMEWELHELQVKTAAEA
jgi:hypothetical protein